MRYRTLNRPTVDIHTYNVYQTIRKLRYFYYMTTEVLSTQKGGSARPLGRVFRATVGNIPALCRLVISSGWFITRS